MNDVFEASRRMMNWLIAILGEESREGLEQNAEKTWIMVVAPGEEQILHLGNAGIWEAGKFVNGRFHSSCVLECAPIIEVGCLREYEACLVSVQWPDERRRKLSLYHELVHMYSSGGWRMEKQSVVHWIGIAKHIYRLEEGGITLHMAENVRVNERITDRLAEGFEQYTADGQKANDELESLCRRYFAHDERLAEEFAWKG